MNVHSVSPLLSSYLAGFHAANSAASASSASADAFGSALEAQFLSQAQRVQTHSPQELQAILSHITGQPVAHQPQQHVRADKPAQNGLQSLWR